MYTVIREGDNLNFSKKGQLIKVNYLIKNLEGEVLQSSQLNNQPLVFQLGDKQIMPSFQQYIKNMSIGQIIEYTTPQHFIQIEFLAIL